MIPRRTKRRNPAALGRILEDEIAARVRAGATYAAIARELAGRGVTYGVVRETARRLGIRRPPGRPRTSDPVRIPSATDAPRVARSALERDALAGRR